MTGMPTRQLTLPHAATDDSETPATAFAGTGLGAGLNAIIDDAKGTAVKVGSGASAPARGKTLVGSGQADADGNQQSIWDRVERKNFIIGGSAQLWDQGTTPTATDNSYIGGNWRILLEAANAATVTREATDLPTSGARWAWKVIAGSGVNNKFGLFQVIEGADIWDLRAAVASLQAAIKIGGTLANMKMGICQWTSTEDATTGDPVSSWGADGVTPTLATNWSFANTPANLSATTSWASYFAENVSISASATNLAVFVWSDDKTTTQTTDFFLLTDVDLERGAVCTSVERLKKSIHKLMDRRFYQKSMQETTAPGTATQLGNRMQYIDGLPSAANRVSICDVHFDIEMRAIPTVTTYDTAGTSGRASTNSALSIVPALSFQSSTGFRVSGQDTGTNGNGYLEFGWQATARI